MYTIEFNEQENNRVYDLNSAITKSDSVYVVVYISIDKPMLVQISKREAYKLAKHDGVYAYWSKYTKNELIIGQ